MIPRKTGSETSSRIATLGSRAMNDPASLTLAEIRELGASTLVQREPPTIPIKPRTIQQAGLAGLKPPPTPPNILAPKPSLSDLMKRRLKG